MFNTNADENKIMEGRPWIFYNSLFVRKQLEGRAQTSSMLFNTQLFWVQMFDLPIRCMNKVYGKQIGESIGRVLHVDVDADEYQMGSFPSSEGGDI